MCFVIYHQNPLRGLDPFHESHRKRWASTTSTTTIGRPNSSTR
ncbi:hypothetical protein GQ55_2G084900 [Panicum hallii var. hallii]|uniref:Uncharacterized protein n=1 Tax=Panicum hallii var. hallii TaxID=1504633 RepID=A0A2T7EMR2_9POAL|nr:hypothetical protein GQ55_2G084900 [Panicum hallii var. hallii]